MFVVNSAYQNDVKSYLLQCFSSCFVHTDHPGDCVENADSDSTGLGYSLRFGLSNQLRHDRSVSTHGSHSE